MVVPNIKDINFWEQFTTRYLIRVFGQSCPNIKDINFESNSQPAARPWLEHKLFEYQRYQLLRAIHNKIWIHRGAKRLFRISKISTFESNSQLVKNWNGEWLIELFRISKISTFESNSQLSKLLHAYNLVVPNIKDINFLRAIHNKLNKRWSLGGVVPNIKDINFWEQFTTSPTFASHRQCCSEYQRYQLLRAIHNTFSTGISTVLLFRISKISTFESNSQPVGRLSINSELFRISKISTFESNSQPTGYASSCRLVVPNIKDINFWEQFTTYYIVLILNTLLFRISKISTFESNSQHATTPYTWHVSCSEYQRYQLLRAIHNGIPHKEEAMVGLFRISKISTFESNSQHLLSGIISGRMLFRISKISTFESNSQQYKEREIITTGCSEYQRYQLLRAIHNE